MKQYLAIDGPLDGKVIATDSEYLLEPGWGGYYLRHNLSPLAQVFVFIAPDATPEPPIPSEPAHSFIPRRSRISFERVPKVAQWA